MVTLQSPRAILAVLTLLCILAAPLRAHPIHTSYGVITRERGVVTLWVRAFSDDFAMAVARYAARPVPRDSSASAVDVARYLHARVHVVDAGGRAVPFTPCGVKRVGAMTWSCATWPDAAGQRLVNRMLAEVHADQVNVVQIAGGTTLLFAGERPRASALR